VGFEGTRPVPDGLPGPQRVPSQTEIVRRPDARSDGGSSTDHTRILLSLQALAGNAAVSSLISSQTGAFPHPGPITLQRKLGPWLTEHSQPIRAALAAQPADYATAFRYLNGFSLEDMVAIMRDLGAGKIRDLKKNPDAMVGFDEPRLKLALATASVPPSIDATRAENLHHLIRGYTGTNDVNYLQQAYHLINGLSVRDQEHALALLDPAHLDVLTSHLGSASGVDTYWVGMVLVGVRGANLHHIVTSLTWLNGQDISAGSEWAQNQPADRVAFMLRAGVQKANGDVFKERLRVMLLAGQLKQAEGEISPEVAARVESALQAAALPAEQRQAVRTFLGIPQPKIPEAELTGTGLSEAELKKVNQPSDALDANCHALFGMSYADYLNTIKMVKAFGTTAMVAPEFGQKLIEADRLAREYVAKFERRPMEADDWDVKSMSGLHPPDSALHHWGLAVDIDYRGQPYLMHESGEADLDVTLAPVYNRISQLILNRPSKIPTGDADYEAYSKESSAMTRYFALMDGRESLTDFLTANPRSDATWSAIFDGQTIAPDARAAQLLTRMQADHAVLTAPAPAKGKDYPFDPTKHADPRKGFLTMRAEVVNALRDVGLRWGGMDFGAGYNSDIMHFDLGHTYVYNRPKGVWERKGEKKDLPAVQRAAATAATTEPLTVIQRHEAGEEDAPIPSEVIGGI